MIKKSSIAQSRYIFQENLTNFRDITASWENADVYKESAYFITRERFRRDIQRIRLRVALRGREKFNGRRDKSPTYVCLLSTPLLCLSFHSNFPASLCVKRQLLYEPKEFMRVFSANKAKQTNKSLPAAGALFRSAAHRFSRSAAENRRQVYICETGK